MIQLHNISLAFGGQQVLDGLTWTIRLNQRIGLIGPNGAGKSTLLRVITGQHPPDDGTISTSGGTTVGYLEQDVQEMVAARSVLAEAMQAFGEVLNLQAEEDRIHGELEAEEDHTTERYDKLLHAQARVHTELMTHEVHLIQPRTEAVLTGLGFAPDNLDRPLSTFSGGWRMRVSLARLLLRRPDILLLDEPTNHLDIDSIDWLEEYLKNYPGTVVIVSHDRYFLDRMVTSIAEISRGRVTEYAGNYAFYLEDRQARRALQQSAYDNQQKQIVEMERFIERFRYKASKARQAQSRVKMLEKMERLLPPPTEESAIRFRFPEPPRSGRTVLELSSFSKTYTTPEGDIPVFDKAGPLMIERGDKVALIGKNGAGKSTLARMVFRTEPFDGTMKTGYQVQPTFFAQHQADTLNPNHTVLESMQAEARGQGETEIRSLLGAFLFTGDDVLKPIGVLSGGEKSRVALAHTLLRPANFLILDEPTNHLDIQSINVLIEALRQYTGTFVIVSHDRHFLDRVINKVWRVEDGTVRTYLGNYSEYLWQTQHGTASRFEQEVPKAPPTAPASEEEAAASGPKTKEQKRREAEERNRRYREMQENGEMDYTILTPRQIRQEYEKLEARILDKEERKTALETTLGDPDLYTNPDRARDTTAAYEALKAELAELYKQWEEAAEQLAG